MRSSTSSWPDTSCRDQSGMKWDYSNIGYSLLGQALAARAGTDYESLLRTRVVAPLELNRTGITLIPRLEGEARHRSRCQFAADTADFHRPDHGRDDAGGRRRVDCQ